MRITADQEIAGYSALKIRELLRKAVSGTITAALARNTVGCSTSEAGSLLNKLHEDGFLESAGRHFGVAMKGNALANATVALPLRRVTAVRLVESLVHRAHKLNCDDRWAYRVRKLIVFGSYVRGADRPNDVDVACELRPRWGRDRQLEHEQVRRRLRRKPFRNISQWASWPRIEVIRYLRARTRGLSMHDLEEWILNTPDHEVIFQDEARNE